MVPDPSEIWTTYADLVINPALTALIFLIVSRLLRAAVGRWFYGR